MNYYVDWNEMDYNEKYDPVLRYEDYIPDDFLIAPGPNLEYTYYITDPIYNELLYDLKYDLAPDALRARSEYIDNQYRWIYEAHWSFPMEWLGGPDNEYLDLLDTWSTPTSQELYPQTVSGEWDFDIVGAKRDLITGGVTLKIKIESNYPSYGNWYNKETGKTELSFTPNPELRNTQFLSLYINDDTTPLYTYNMQEHRPDNFLFFKKEGENFWDQELVYVPEWNQPKYIEVEIPPEMSYDPLYVNVSAIEQKKEITGPGPHVNDVDVYRRPNTSENFIIPLKQQNNFEVNFINSDTCTISVPYEIRDGVVTKKEEFKFKKLFNQYKYPTTTRDIFSLEYSKGSGPEIPAHFNNEYKAKVDINGVNTSEVTIKTRVEGGRLIFSIDDHMYYNTDKKVVEKGITNEGYLNEEGLVLPWDYSSKGTIKFEVELQTHQTYTFDVNMSVGSERPLRGKGGEFQFVEVSNEK